jgi:hypothetical protein
MERYSSINASNDQYQRSSATWSAPLRWQCRFHNCRHKRRRLVLVGLRRCLVRLRRHVNTCCGVRPCRRATSETTAPGASVSPTTCVLKSSVNCRRRPVPVITSTRRTVVTSGSSSWSSVDTSRSPIQRSAHSTIIRHHKRWGRNSAYKIAALGDNT